jgi:hypothetical protein
MYLYTSRLQYLCPASYLTITTRATMDLTAGIHVPTSISPEDFERGRLKPISYTREAISAVIIANSNKRFEGNVASGRISLKRMSERQKESISRAEYQCTWNLFLPGDLDDLKRFFEIFDDAFFGGLLKGFCKLELVDSRYMSNRRWYPVVGGVCHSYFPGNERDRDLNMRNR